MKWTHHSSYFIKWWQLGLLPEDQYKFVAGDEELDDEIGSLVLHQMVKRWITWRRVQDSLKASTNYSK
jgi:EAL domain-containing protein (putative c-di-GMP-specific phosphodiesterase class I)